MTGAVSIQEIFLDASISDGSSLEATIESDMEIIGVVDIATGYDIYLGVTEINPDFYDQTLETENKVVPENITVKKINVSVTPNESGGATVYIG